jgi:hypothetical protein
MTFDWSCLQTGHAIAVTGRVITSVSQGIRGGVKWKSARKRQTKAALSASQQSGDRSYARNAQPEQRASGQANACFKVHSPSGFLVAWLPPRRCISVMIPLVLAVIRTVSCTVDWA